MCHFLQRFGIAGFHIPSIYIVLDCKIIITFHYNLWSDTFNKTSSNNELLQDLVQKDEPHIIQYFKEVTLSKKKYHMMERKEAMLWLITLTETQSGSKTDQKILRRENKLSKENGQPSVEEELESMLGENAENDQN